MINSVQLEILFFRQMKLSSLRVIEIMTFRFTKVVLKSIAHQAGFKIVTMPTHSETTLLLFTQLRGTLSTLILRNRVCTL